MRLLITWTILLLTCFSVHGQTIKITGKFIDENFQPVKGATLKTIDEQYLATLDNNGRFQIEIPADTKQFKVYFIGLETKVIDVNGQVINRIMFTDNREEGFGYSKRLTRKIEKREIKRRLSLYDKAEKQKAFDN
ncbi:MAG: hypothetical protein JNM78_12735 [Cyclobacteriaceae bacterium]|nr:hypothetical protein [Cyclobacteriaceae bacterium]